MDVTLAGVLLTAIIWAPVNAASEQLLWIYIFESWDLYPLDRHQNYIRRWGYRAVGLLFFSTFVGLIHTMFWLNFLHTVDSEIIFGLLFVLTTTISGYIHIWV